MIFSFKCFARMMKNRGNVKKSTFNIISHEKPKNTQNQHNWSSLSVSRPFPFILNSFSIFSDFEVFELTLNWLRIDFVLVLNRFFWIDICSLWFTYEFTWKTYLSWFYSFEKNLYCFSWINLSKIYQLSLIKA